MNIHPIRAKRKLLPAPLPRHHRPHKRGQNRRPQRQSRHILQQLFDHKQHACDRGIKPGGQSCCGPRCQQMPPMIGRRGKPFANLRCNSRPQMHRRTLTSKGESCAQAQHRTKQLHHSDPSPKLHGQIGQRRLHLRNPTPRRLRCQALNQHPRQPPPQAAKNRQHHDRTTLSHAPHPQAPDPANAQFQPHGCCT